MIACHGISVIKMIQIVVATTRLIGDMHSHFGWIQNVVVFAEKSLMEATTSIILMYTNSKISNKVFVRRRDPHLVHVGVHSVISGVEIIQVLDLNPRKCRRNVVLADGGHFLVNSKCLSTNTARH